MIYRFISRHRKKLLCVILIPIGILAYNLSLRLTNPVQFTVTSLEQPALSKHLTIAAYNIAHGRGNDPVISNWNGESEQVRTSRLDAIQDLIRHRHPDILILNECDFDCSWSHSVNQAEYLANGLYPYVITQRNFGARLPFQQWSFGNAILSKYKPTHFRFINFEPKKRYYEWLFGDKNGLLIHFNDTNGKPFRVLAIHLESSDKITRMKAAQRILSIEQQEDSPLILAGDFNSSQHDTSGNKLEMTVMQQFFDSGKFQSAFPSSPTLTFPATQPSRQIDWILTPPTWLTDKTFCSPETHSDHLYIEATVSPAINK